MRWVLVSLVGCVTGPTHERGAPGGVETPSIPEFSAEASDSSSPTDLTGGDERACDADARWPVPHWETGFPEDHGMDPLLLEEAADYARSVKSTCMAVVRDGVLVGEWTFRGNTAADRVKSWSVAKSYAATVVGRAYTEGYLHGIDDPIADYLTDWQGTDRDGISIHHMLSMTSGLKFDLWEDNVEMFLADDMTALALANPVRNPPGSTWEYNNHTVQLADPLLEAATGMSTSNYAQSALFEPLGMSAEWETDDVGHPAMYMNVLASCRDHAKMAYLYLQDGCWDGERLLATDFVDRATSSSSTHNRGYGYWWWLNGEAPLLDSVDFHVKPGWMHDDAPEDAYCAAGLGSQMVEVIPSLDLIVVRMGVAPIDDLSLWLHPLDLLDAMLTDGEQEAHNGVLDRVLSAVVEE